MAAASRKLAASPPAPMPASDGNWSFDAGSFGTLIGANCILNPGGLQVAVLASSSILAIDVLSGEQIAGKNLPYQPDFQDDEGFSLVCAAAGCVYFVEQGKLRALQLHDGRFKGAAPSGQSNDGFDGSGWADADVSGAFQVAGVGDILVVLRTVKTGNAPASVQVRRYLFIHSRLLTVCTFTVPRTATNRNADIIVCCFSLLDLYVFHV